MQSPPTALLDSDNLVLTGTYSSPVECAVFAAAIAFVLILIHNRDGIVINLLFVAWRGVAWCGCTEREKAMLAGDPLQRRSTSTESVRRDDLEVLSPRTGVYSRHSLARRVARSLVCPSLKDFRPHAVEDTFKFRANYQRTGGQRTSEIATRAPSKRTSSVRVDAWQAELS